MPRARLVLAALAVASILATRATTAHADPAAPAYSYEIENDPPAGTVLVVWPRACSASGEPLGNVDLALNPDWASRKNDVDYEVIVKRTRYSLLEPCLQTSRLYLLPTDVFPPGSRLSTADDVSIGQPEAGMPFPIVPALDAIDRKERIALFDHDPRLRRTPFHFAATAPPPSAVTVHEVLSLAADPTPTTTTFTITQLRVDYTYQDAAPSSSPASASASAPAPAPASAPAPAPGPAPAPAPAPDLGTRWVLLAALSGLLAGGLLAYSRKRRTPEK